MMSIIRCIVLYIVMCTGFVHFSLLFYIATNVFLLVNSTHSLLMSGNCTDICAIYIAYVHICMYVCVISYNSSAILYFTFQLLNCWDITGIELPSCSEQLYHKITSFVFKEIMDHVYRGYTYSLCTWFCRGCAVKPPMRSFT